MTGFPYVNTIPIIETEPTYKMGLSLFKLKLQSRKKQKVPIVALEMLELTLKSQTKSLTLLSLSQIDLSKISYKEVKLSYDTISQSTEQVNLTDSDEELI